MKKVIFLFTLILCVGAVMAEDQTVSVLIGGAIDVSVSDNIDYGTVAPGASSDANSTITVGSNNNVDLTVNIQITDSGTNDLFQNIIFDLNNNGFDESIIGTSLLTKYIDDIEGNHILPTRLQVPSGFDFGQNTGVISYIFMERDNSYYYYHSSGVGTTEQDCFNNGTEVCITRDLSGPAFQAGTDAVQWGCGACGSVTQWFPSLSSSFKNDCIPTQLMDDIVNVDVCLNTVTYGDWDIDFSWYQSGGDGGFAYTREQ